MPRKTKQRLFVDIDVSGDEELQQAIVNAAQRVSSDAVVDVLMQAATAVRDHARALVRVKTGALRDAIFASRGRPFARPGSVSVIAGVSPKRAPHRHLVEYGHAGPRPAPPHPFWRPAVMIEWPIQRELIIRRVRDLIRRLA